MSIIAIVAVAKNMAIGRGGTLPWHYPSDLKFFREKTSGNAVVMGYNTWLSIGRPLPNRQNIVISRTRSIEDHPEVVVMRTREEVLEFAKNYGKDTFIIGGAETYSLFSDDIDEWIVTEVPLEVPDADAFMPEDFLKNHSLYSSDELEGGILVRTFLRNPGTR